MATEEPSGEPSTAPEQGERKGRWVLILSSVAVGLCLVLGVLLVLFWEDLLHYVLFWGKVLLLWFSLGPR